MHKLGNIEQTAHLLLHFLSFLLWRKRGRGIEKKKEREEKNERGREKNQYVPWVLTWPSLALQALILKMPSLPFAHSLVKEASTDFSRTFRILINFTA